MRSFKSVGAGAGKLQLQLKGRDYNNAFSKDKECIYFIKTFFQRGKSDHWECEKQVLFLPD